ncbi:hypothetical protein DFQ14_101405 [Halopolyspora algeriensis]|uniref:Uncharacterized protein n=1 Tax=Halopolyspora algeriensis TaxID=1500506 RepID=A0A368VYN7_9ACTN|nr:hypothetical protein [Halopolyspora algeriensis]RCW47061.1 hypothetical protein DFQ14_101405 [Halopolyspora algeriensis]TQM48148.1 hypothetical protein FHU43_3110 [Halopolyspora algeriensis]
MADDSQDLIKVREVTDIHSNWSEHGSGEPGKFSFQLILDDGAEEAVIRPSAKSAKVLVGEFTAGKSFYYDTDREVLLLRDLE